MKVFVDAATLDVTLRLRIHYTTTTTSTQHRAKAAEEEQKNKHLFVSTTSTTPSKPAACLRYLLATFARSYFITFPVVQPSTAQQLEPPFRKIANRRRRNQTLPLSALLRCICLFRFAALRRRVYLDLLCLPVCCCAVLKYTQNKPQQSSTKHTKSCVIGRRQPL